jgi:enamine deaminase RidA (YjgF/YER057c/UK114 family)
MDIDDRLRDLGIELPTPFPPAGNYVAAVRTGNLLHTSGMGPVRPDGTLVAGKVGADVDLAAAVEAARLTGLQLLAAVRAELGSLDRVTRVVKLVGFVASDPAFTGQPGVVNGASDLIGEVFGEAGAHARSAVGVAELPLNAPVEVELVVEVG